jgi:multiple sugar transport system permease protein
MISSLYLSFTNFDLLTTPQWVGVDNYVRMFTNDPKFSASMRVTLFFVIFSVPLKLAFALGVALLLNRGMKGLTIYRSLFYLPSLLGASVAIAILWRQIFAGDGLVNKFLAIFGIVGPSWISNPQYSLWTLIVLSIWQFGSPMIIFLAGLRQIPQDMYEAASLDGASKWRQFWKITLPLLTPVVFFNAIIQTIEAFKSFTPAFIISGGTGNPINSTLFYTLYLYQEAFGFFRMGYASALAWVLLALVGLFTAFSFLTSKYWVHYDE